MGQGGKQLVVFDWGVSSFYGWGIYGLNLMLSWLPRQDFQAVSAAQINPADIVLGPVEWAVIKPLIEASRSLVEGRSANQKLSTMVLRYIGNDIEGRETDPILGDPTIGVVFSESTSFSALGRERAKRYPLLISGSRWNSEVLTTKGFGPVTTVMQGVDTSHFHPAPKSSLFRDRFIVFSGGKLEKRKGQDLVIEAFRIFAERHSDAVLLTTWGSPWPYLATSLSENPRLAPVKFLSDNSVDIAGWTGGNGIPASQVVHLGSVPHIHMAHILRGADVAVFPNRAEGGTNLVAMECMACGVPTILSANTGHLDLIDEGNCYPLSRQSPIGGAEHQGWGESDVDEIADRLEHVYANREEAARRGARGSEFISQFTWTRQMGQLAEVLKPYAGSSRQ